MSDDAEPDLLWSTVSKNGTTMYFFRENCKTTRLKKATAEDFVQKLGMTIGTYKKPGNACKTRKKPKMSDEQKAQGRKDRIEMIKC